MEYKFITRVFLLSLTIALWSSACGYYDNDKVIYQNEIAKSILIEKWGNDNSNTLIFKETNDVSAVIVDNCRKIFYDSAARKIYVESYQNETNKDYFQLDILNLSAKYVSQAVLKKRITKSLFEQVSKTISTKWDFEN